MNQRELNRAVARATGESVYVISELGFIPLPQKPREREPQFVDWDESQTLRNLSLRHRRMRTRPLA